jgi:hypothetical protein
MDWAARASFRDHLNRTQLRFLPRQRMIPFYLRVACGAVQSRNWSGCHRSRGAFDVSPSSLSHFSSSSQRCESDVRQVFWNKVALNRSLKKLSVQTGRRLLSIAAYKSIRYVLCCPIRPAHIFCTRYRSFLPGLVPEFTTVTWQC